MSDMQNCKFCGALQLCDVCNVCLMDDACRACKLEDWLNHASCDELEACQPPVLKHRCNKTGVFR